MSHATDSLVLMYYSWNRRTMNYLKGWFLCKTMKSVPLDDITVLNYPCSNVGSFEKLSLLRTTLVKYVDDTTVFRLKNTFRIRVNTHQREDGRYVHCFFRLIDSSMVGPVLTAIKSDVRSIVIDSTQALMFMWVITDDANDGITFESFEAPLRTTWALLMNNYRIVDKINKI
jgi:hypothetical protein